MISQQTQEIDPLLVQCWFNIEPPLGQSLVFAEVQHFCYDTASLGLELDVNNNNNELRYSTWWPYYCIKSEAPIIHKGTCNLHMILD